DTLKKKNVAPLGKNFVFQLNLEGLTGLHRRFQVAMQLMSNTQHLGIVVKGEYMHLSRSLAALIGTYLKLYKQVPIFFIPFDFFKTLTLFPVEYMKDMYRVNPILFKKQIIEKVPVPFWIKQNTLNYPSLEIH
ncbi:MAG: hypothetical protein HQK77_20840, partial [Desulfobacterales bacterium]|nr:hypothetical protein [Desulfobacterales bacterium]